MEVNFDKVIDCCFYRSGDTSQIADWFIKRAFSERNTGTILTQLKLQKLLYYAYVWWLIMQGKRLFHDEIEAWEFGPVVRKQYTRLKKYNEKAIKLQEINTNIEEIPKEIQQHLEMIWHKYGKYEAHHLVEKTNSERPWQDAFNSNDKKKIISDDAIKEYYMREMLEAV